jgi:hypothetical protein
MAALRHHVKDRQRLLALAAAGIALTVPAAFTTAFTRGADIVTAVPIGIAALVLVRRMRGDRHPALEQSAPRLATPATPLNRWALVWLGLAAAVIGWESHCYFSAPRFEHPTLSVLIDMATASQSGRGVSFLVWLALGLYLSAR